ncbi:hypothetical protein JWH04_13845 [Xanthomonas melonis]|uniref:hypothetical protein n=1 Tax=Xanthomonas melonis TaxID=56456 RepID=UPI001E2D6371|nr:hypothetical protein [Xanthomonas melonis]MCD0280006.1 hypothetical protein [Xanthomonas melonis]
MSRVSVEIAKDDQLVKQGSFVEATLELGRNLVTTAVMAAASAKVMGDEIGAVLQPFVSLAVAPSVQAVMAIFLLSMSLFWLILSGMRYFKYFESNFRKKGGIKFSAAASLMILAGVALVVLTFGVAAIGVKK